MNRHRWKWCLPISVIAVLVLPMQAVAQGGDRPEPEGYAFYWSGACVEAMRRSNAFYYYDYPDTSRFTLTDTLIDATKQVARECLREMDGIKIPPFHAVTLAQVYGSAGFPDSARMVVDRRLAEPDAQRPGPRAWILQDAITTLLIRPANFDLAKHYLAELNDIANDSALVGKLLASDRMAAYYQRINNDSAMVRQARSTIEIAKMLPRSEQNEFLRAIVMSYRLLLEDAAERTGDAKEISPILEEAKATMAGLPNAPSPLNLMTALFGLIGKPAAPLSADIWVAGDSIHPLAGRVTLINFGPARENIPALRRLASTFGDTLRIVSILNTRGFFAGHGLLTPEFEALDLKEHFVDSLALPGALGIVATSFTTMPDGRKRPNPDPNSRAYNPQSRVSLVLVDKEGTIRRVWQGWGRKMEMEILEAVEKYR